MPHALIIDDNLVVSKVLEECLSKHGFTSFSHAWTEHDAIHSADARRPDLVIVGDGVEAGSGFGAAASISQRYGVPALMVTANSSRAQKELPEGCSLEGPYALRDFDRAFGARRLS